jgi:wobble nucleotide-excising tRNase
MIQHLGNSDWIRQGMKYLGHTDDDCPFCQQKLPHEFEKSLEDYFDETFEAETRETLKKVSKSGEMPSIT